MSQFLAPTPPSNSLPGLSNPASGLSLSPEQVRSSLATDQIKFLEKRLQDQTLEFVQLKESIRHYVEAAGKGKAEMERFRNREQELVAQVEASKKQLAINLTEGSRPRTFTRFDDLKDAYATFCADAKLGDQELVTLYESLLASNPGKAGAYAGAMFQISRARSSPSLLAVHEHGIIAKELSEYLESVKLPVQSSLKLAMEDTHESVEKEKTRAARLDAKLSLAKKDVEAKITEVKKWRLKVESLEKELAAGPSRKAAVLKVDLDRATDDKKKAENELAGLRKRIERETKGKTSILERLEQAECKVQELEDSRRELASLKRKLEDLEGELATARAANSTDVARITPASYTSTGSGAEKFVIERLAKTVKQLSAELTSKTAENAELMMRLSQSGC